VWDDDVTSPRPTSANGDFSTNFPSAYIVTQTSFILQQLSLFPLLSYPFVLNQTRTTSTTIMTNPSLDPYTEKAQKNSFTPQEKIDGLHAIVKSVKTGMLTTRTASGELHSRAMVPAGPYNPTQATLVFIANRASAKFDEIENDSHVNVAFYDESSTNWASYAGIAKISQDKALIAKHWSSATAAWFGDLGDGIHKGDQHDPRVAVIEVIPNEIRYWKATSGLIGRTVDVAVSAVSGKTAAPGDLVTISKDEIQLLNGIQSK